MLTQGPRWPRTQSSAALLVALCLALLALTATASASSSQPAASASATAVRTALTARAAADSALRSSSKTLKRCLRRHPMACKAARRARRRASKRLTSVERLLAGLNANIARHRSKGKRFAPNGPGSGSPTGTRQGLSSANATSGSGGAASGSSTHSTQGTSPTNGSDSPVEGANLGGPFEMGLVAGSALTYELPFIQRLGAHTARMEFSIDTPASQIAPIAEAYARAGVRPLLLATFDGAIPSSSEAQSLGAWAAAVGPGGSVWQGKGFPADTAVTSIEFGNETSYSYQYTDDSASGYAARAQSYAIRFAEAQESIQATNPSVGLLAQGDPGNAPGTSWMDNMFKAVPNLGSLVAGWTVHPYGPNWQPIMDKVISSARADGAPSSIPLDVTEWGLSTDNGRCLESNYGFNSCMTYQEASTTVQSTVAAMHARYGSRLAALYLYQAHDQKVTGASTNRESYFGVLQSNEAAKGAYTTTVESLLSTNQ
jgi:hypothetical protein